MITRLPIISVALVSATALAYEILLTRLFSIIQWHHYAFMIISLALLGYGASGTFLALARSRLLAHYSATYIASLVLFSIATLLCFPVAQSIAFNPEEILFDAGQWWRLAAIYLVLSLPFFFAATAIGLSLTRFRSQLAGIYAADLLGAGAGSLAIVVLLFAAFPMQALKLLFVAGIVAALIASRELRISSRLVPLTMACLITAPFVVPAHWVSLKMSPYKDLSQVLRISGSQVVEQVSSPLGLVHVVGNEVIPLRHAPGLSLNAITGPPSQLGLFVDGNGPSAIDRVAGSIGAPGYLGKMTSALAYRLRRPDNVLVLGAGGGTMVLQALQLGAGHVDAIELDPQIIGLVRDHFADFSGRLYGDKRVRVFAAESRGFLTRHPRRYDLVQLPVLDSHSASATGLHALGEDYLYTVEAFEAYLRHLAPGGLLSVTRWVKIPPRDTLKAFATAVLALERSGLDRIGQRLALIRGWQTSTLLVKNGVFTTGESAAIRDFARKFAFDIVWLPDMSPDEANRVNILPEPWFHSGASALLGEDRDDYLRDYKFNLAPSTDDQPFFFNFFRWRSLPEIARRYGEGGVPLLDTGYLILIATLLQAILASIILVLLPLVLIRDRTTNNPLHISRTRILAYFTALGGGFLFIEIAFIQKLTLFLHHPLYALAVALTAFLVFAGLGSAWAQRRIAGNPDAVARTGIVIPVLLLVLLSGAYIAFLPTLLDHLIQLPDILRVVISITVIAPLAFCMGIPFPTGLWQLGAQAPALVPWAWGINGCASVISTVLATLVAVHYGFTVVVIAAVALYLIAAASFPRMRPVSV